MNFPIPNVVISSILGDYGPLAKVTAHWPLVEAALDAEAIYSPLCAVAAIATISIKTGRFSPLKERGGPTYLSNLYEKRADLGNHELGDGAKFQGRGFIQIVGRRAYEHFGCQIGRDLISNPDDALDPRVAAEIFAVYFNERGVRVFADQQNWEIVMRRVTSDLTEFPRFTDTALKLVAALNIGLPASVTTSQETIDGRA